MAAGPAYRDRPDAAAARQHAARVASSQRWFNFNAPVERVETRREGIVVHTPQGEVPVDFLILATGYALDWHARPEFHALVDQVKTRGDARQPPADKQNAQLASYPIWGLISRFRQNTVTAPLRWRGCTVLATRRC